MRQITVAKLVRHWGSQRKASHYLGVTQQCISKWKAKGRVPRQWQALARMLGVES